MPSMKCTNCGYRILLPSPTSTCANCGTPFTAPAPGSSTKPSPTSSSYSPVPVPTPVPPIPMPSGSPGSPVPSSPTSTSLYGPVPSSMPTRSPDLEGKIALPPVNGPQQIQLDWSQIVLRVLFFPFFLRETIKKGSLPKPTMMVHRWLIARASDRATYEARVEGDLTGSQPSLHQRVSLWGHYRGGALIVNRGYNHDTTAEIHVRRPVTLWLSRFAAVSLPLLILAIIVLYPGLILATISALWTLLLIGIVLYILIAIFLPWIPKRIVNFLVLAFILYIAVSACSHALMGTQLH